MSAKRIRVHVSQDTYTLLEELGRTWGALKPFQAAGVLVARYARLELAGASTPGLGVVSPGPNVVSLGPSQATFGRSSEDDLREEVREEEEDPDQKSLDSSSDDSGGPASPDWNGQASPEERELLLELRRQRAEKGDKEPLARPSTWEEKVLRSLRADEGKRARTSRQAASRATRSKKPEDQVVADLLARERLSEALLRLAEGSGIKREHRAFCRAMAPKQLHGYPLRNEHRAVIRQIAVDANFSPRATDATKKAAKEVREWLK